MIGNANVMKEKKKDVFRILKAWSSKIIIYILKENIYRIENINKL